MGFFSNFERAMYGNDSYEIKGRPVTCSHCGEHAFEEGMPSSIPQV